VVVDAGGAVRAVLNAWGADRGAELIRRFDHGVGGTSLIELDGCRRVLKAWPLKFAGYEAEVDSALTLAEIMRGRGVAVPALIERGRSAGCGYLVYELIDGEWSSELGPGAVADMLMVIDAARDAAPAPNVGWPAELQTMLAVGDASFDIAPDALAGSPAAEAVLAEARHRLHVCDPGALRTTDVMHGDFAPENLLIRDGRVVGVVDWERARIGDSGLDLVGAIFDIEIGQKAPAPLRQSLWSMARDRMPPDTLAAYVGVYAVRYLSWSVGTDMEGQVVELANLTLGMSAVSSPSP